MRRFAILAIAFASIAVAACDDERPINTNEVPPVVTNDADECPRADGTPCR